MFNLFDRTETSYDDLGTVDPRELPTGSMYPEPVGEFNLVRVIMDHAPPRLKDIDAEIRFHRDMIARLEQESSQLKNILNAVNQ